MNQDVNKILQGELDDLDELIETLTEYRDGCSDDDYEKIDTAISVVCKHRLKVIKNIKDNQDE